MKRTEAVWLFLLGCMVAAGCAGSVKKPVVVQEKVVEKSREERPGWIEVPVEVREDRFLFSGGVAGRDDFSLALRQARGEVIKNITQGIQETVEKEFREALRGVSIEEWELKEVLTDTVGKMMEVYEIHGLKPKEVYYEKVERSSGEGVEYYYNCYNLVELSREEYNEWRHGALLSIRDTAKKEGNTRREEIVSRLLERLYAKEE